VSCPGEKLKQFGEDFAARQAARARLPRLVALATVATSIICLLLTVWLLFSASVLMRGWLHPSNGFGHLPGPGSAFMAFASLFAAIPLSLMLANFVLWVIPPLRNAYETAFANAPRASFRDGMRQLGVVALFILPICAIAAAIGIIDPWLN
jgi:hypothetical protein